MISQTVFVFNRPAIFAKFGWELYSSPWDESNTQNSVSNGRLSILISAINQKNLSGDRLLPA
jgi:hypothetical protein